MNGAKVFVVESEVGIVGVLAESSGLDALLRSWFEREETDARTEAGWEPHTFADVTIEPSTIDGKPVTTWQVRSTCPEFPDEPYPYQSGWVQEWALEGISSDDLDLVATALRFTASAADIISLRDTDRHRLIEMADAITAS